MAEIQDDKERKKLYGLLVSDPATRKNTAQYSFKQWESKLLGDEENIKRVADYAVKKNWSYDQDDFFRKYAPEKLAKPQPQVQAAPAMQMAAPMEEEEAYTPPPQPLVGTPEYDAQLQAQYGGMSPTLGATFGGVPASFETKAQKKQEQISPVFKAQQLAFEDVPIAEDQRKAQRQFAKAEKQQQQAALRGGAGFELQQEKRRKERGYGEAAADLTGTIAAGGKRIGEGIVSTLQNYVNATLRGGLPYIPATESVENIANYELYKNATNAQNAFQEEVAKRNIQTSVLQAIEKGEYGKIPEATMYTIGDAAMQIIPAILTIGGSTYFQTLPEAYKNGVDAIAKEKGMSPEQVVASGEDAKIVAEINAGVQSGLEFVGANLVSSSIASRGGYKVMRDWLLGQGVNRNLARGASLLGVGIGEGVTEYLQEGTGQIGTTVAKSPTTKAFLDKLPKELFSPEAKKQRKEAFVGGLIGGLGVGGGGQAVQSAMDRTLFEAPVIGKATQRPDMDIVLTDDKLQQRKKLNQAMESAIKANPEAEGQIRERYRKLNDALELTDNEVLSAYDGISQLPPSPEKDRMLQDLEAYMAEKGIQPEAVGMDAGLGEGLRVTTPSEEATVIQTVNPQFPPPQPPAPTEEQIADDIQNKRFATFTYKSEEEVPEQFRDRISSKGETNGVPFVNVTLPQSVADYELSRVSPEAAPEVTPTETAPLEEAPVEEAIQEDEDLASLGQAISGLEQAPVEEDTPEEEAAPVAPVQEFRPELPEIQVPKPEGFAPFLRKLGYTDEEISKMSFEQQQEIATNKTEPARAEGSSKVDVSKENQRVEKAAEAQRKLDEEIAAEEAALAAEEVVAAAPAPAKTNEQQIAILRAEEQAELDSKIKDANKYRGKDGKVDRSKLTNKADIKVFDEVYAKYDKLISPLMEAKPEPKKEQVKPAETKAEPTAKKIDKKSVQDSLEKAKEEYEKAKGAFDKKRLELDKTTREDVKDLFGERKVEMKAKGLFEMPRISPEQRERAIQPFRDRMNKAKEEVNRLTKMLEEGEEAAKELTFIKQKEYEQVQGVSEETRKGKSTPKAERAVRPKAKPIRNAGKTPDAITARNIAFYGDPVATTLQYLMDATYHPDLLERIFGGPSKTTKSGRKNISGERRSRIQFLDNNSNVKTADKLAEVLAERYAEENSITVKDAEQQHDFASIATDIVSSYSSRSQMVRELLRLNDQQSEAFDFMYNPEEIYGEGYNEDIAKDIDGILDELPDSYWEGKEISDEDFGNLFAEEVESETKAEAKPTTGTPQEGTTVEIAPQREGGSPRKMVFKDGEWKQNVGGDIVKVGPSVQQQAQEMFGGKAEAKPDEKEAESFANDLEKALNAMKVKVGKGVALEGTFMIPVLVYNGAIDAAILAVKAGKTVVDAINVAVKYVNDNLKSDWDNSGFIGKLSVDLTKPMESYEDYKRVKGKGKEPSPGQKVGVRFNLNIQDYGRRNVLSVHEKNYNGEVIDIVNSSTVSDVKFSASKSGASKIKEGLSNKFPIASVDGSFVSSDADKTLTESGQRVFFNPRVADFFYDKDGREVLSASKATLDGSKVFADGLEYGERLAPINQQQTTTTAQAEFNSKQESSASQEFDGMKKPSKIKTKSFDSKHGKGAFERMKNITDNFEDIMDGMSGKIKQDCL